VGGKQRNPRRGVRSWSLSVGGGAGGKSSTTVKSQGEERGQKLGGGISVMENRAGGNGGENLRKREGHALHHIAANPRIKGQS